VLVYSTPERRPQTSWRSWGGIQTRAQADEEARFLPICRSQIDVRFSVDCRILAERMPGFHWMTGYGDYLREIGHALKKAGLSWEVLAG